MPVKTKRTHKKLTQSQRETIGRMSKCGYAPLAIADACGVNRTSIGRELRRNACACGTYDPAKAQAMKVQRQARAPTKMTGDLLAEVLALLDEHQAPAEICERLRQADSARTVCAETIYTYVNEDAAEGGTLYLLLPMRRRKRKGRKTGRAKRGPIPDRVDIGKRPPEVALLVEKGHWEGDTVHGTKGAVVTLVERVTGLTLVRAVPNLRARTAAAAVIRMTRGYLVRSITFDNGSEFAEHRHISRRIKAPCFFATPGHPCERGRNENKNRQLRRLHRKGKVAYRYIRASEVRRVQDRLNQKLRKNLGWRCADDFLAELKYHGPGWGEAA